MQNMTLRDVFEDWLRLFDPQQSLKNALLAELAKAEAAVDLAEWFTRAWCEPSSQMRESERHVDRLACRYWDAKQAADKFRTNQ